MFKQTDWHGLIAITHKRNNDTSALNASPHWTAASERGGDAGALVKIGVLAL
ncbi:hypothetical protein [Anaerotignum neopropionicum]|uniref:hypothetical protein n=1 Tax=Anaerotignum neopropionicum TaxID=36847 RepID=UPI0012FE0B5B|nr:hypothetical protein [Anaerotignum neopropionicum]